MLLNTAGINAVTKALSAAHSAAASSKGGPKYKKAPDAPKRFKSAFIIFSAEKHKEIKEDLISQGRTEKVRYLLWVSFGEEPLVSSYLPINSTNLYVIWLLDNRHSQASIRGVARNATRRKRELGKESS
jgi:hypothetical protein